MPLQVSQVSDETIREIIDALTLEADSLGDNSSARKAVLFQAFPNNVLQRDLNVDTTGKPNEYATLLIKRLYEYGEDSQGKLVLSTFLQEIAKKFGGTKHNLLNALATQVEQEMGTGVSVTSPDSLYQNVTISQAVPMWKGNLPTLADALCPDRFPLFCGREFVWATVDHLLQVPPICRVLRVELPYPDGKVPVGPPGSVARQGSLGPSRLLRGIAACVVKRGHIPLLVQETKAPTDTAAFVKALRKSSQRIANELQVPKSVWNWDTPLPEDSWDGESGSATAIRRRLVALRSAIGGNNDDQPLIVLLLDDLHRMGGAVLFVREYLLGMDGLRDQDIWDGLRVAWVEATKPGEGQEVAFMQMKDWTLPGMERIVLHPFHHEGDGKHREPPDTIPEEWLTRCHNLYLHFLTGWQDDNLQTVSLLPNSDPAFAPAVRGLLKTLHKRIGGVPSLLNDPTTRYAVEQAIDGEVLLRQEAPAP